MRQIHRNFAILIFLTVCILAYFFGAVISETATQNLTTFFSVSFGFYITSISILYNSNYSKKLSKEIDDVFQNKTKLQVIKNYFLFCGKFSIFTVILIFIFTAFSKKDDKCNCLELIIFVKNINIQNFNIDTVYLINSILYGIFFTNIFLLYLLFRQILNGMMQEAKE